MYLFLGDQHSDCHTETVDGFQATLLNQKKTRATTYLIVTDSVISNCAFAQSAK